MDKAPDAFRTISEVADELDIPQHVLRFWESRFPQIKPMKRAGGRRYYRPEDVDLLRGIKHLLYAEGYTIRGAQAILRDKGQKFVQTVWQPGAAGADEVEPAEAPVEEAGEGATEEAPRSLFGLLRSAPRASEEPEDAAPQPAEPAPQLSRENVRRLQSALHELRECRQAIDQALKEQAA
ncbi:MAG: MerR family transcriptional regulator [Xanthobacteraceae bacterium]|nr:MerR family transcriptional regulator [Xanthobacteraceae bacterium]